MNAAMPTWTGDESSPSYLAASTDPLKGLDFTRVLRLFGFTGHYGRGPRRSPSVSLQRRPWPHQ